MEDTATNRPEKSKSRLIAVGSRCWGNEWSQGAGSALDQEFARLVQLYAREIETNELQFGIFLEIWGSLAQTSIQSKLGRRSLSADYASIAINIGADIVQMPREIMREHFATILFSASNSLYEFVIKKTGVAPEEFLDTMTKVTQALRKSKLSVEAKGISNEEAEAGLRFIRGEVTSGRITEDAGRHYDSAIRNERKEDG